MPEENNSTRRDAVQLPVDRDEHAPWEMGAGQRGLEGFLDEVGLGAGPIEYSSIGGGHSNLTFLIERGDRRIVLRRPPRGKIAPSTHDVLREARILQAMSTTTVQVPEILATCDDRTVLGCPFYLMDFIDGHVLGEDLPAVYQPNEAQAAIGREFIDALAELHSLDTSNPSFSGLGRPVGYLQRQIRRFRSLLEEGATRPLPDLDYVADWLEINRPTYSAHALVHGDYRLGNVMFGGDAPRLTAILDWEMATLGDPLADLGYCTAAWAEPDDEPNPLIDLSRITRGPGFPSRKELVDRYVEKRESPVDHLLWYQVLAVWKAAIFLEGSFNRHLSGDSIDPYFATLDQGVPALGVTARRWIAAGEA
jgi:aminoglycoside phosphotransferase (APT) family kinase protein